MARGDYTPEIKTAMATGKPKRPNTSPPKESPADVARDKSRGIKEGSAQDMKLDAQPQNQTAPPMHMQTGGGGPPDAHHVAAAAGIAHAILGKRSMGGGMY